MAQLRVGLVGCGRIAERGYAPAFARAEGVELAAVADPVRERCERVAPGAPSFRSAAELLAAGAADALVLATPAAAHLRDARLAAEACVPVLIEKPPASSVDEAAELAALDPSPRIGFNRRFEPACTVLRDAGRRASQLELSFDLRARKRSWRPYDVDDDVLLDLGPHLVDLAIWISGTDVELVDAYLDGDRAALELKLGERGVARISCGEGPYRERLEVRAGQKTLARNERGGLRAAAGAIVLRRESPLVPSLAAQLESFARAVAGGGEPDLATAADGLRVMRVLTTARQLAERT
ncbi:MAG TPA: Gfo/Idh/MocA family oxidoreductase [Gaiellaceae bacterium]